jgi:4-hydroxybenzoate polyprenyltransferase
MLPHFNKIEEAFTLSLFQFCLLIASTVAIAAFGYLWNDYNDANCDRINHPNKKILSELFSQKTMYFVLGFLAFLSVNIGIYIAFLIGNFKCVLFQIVALGLLWFYSTHYKKQFLVGNFIISFLSLMMFVQPAFYDPIMFPPYYNYEMPVVALIIKIMFFYGIIVFLVSLMRELIKDVEDREGDMATVAYTLPIVWNVRKMKRYFYCLMGIYFFILTLVLVLIFEYIKIDFAAIIIMLMITPAAYSTYIMAKASTKADYTHVSLSLKILMLSGLISMFFVRNFYVYL